MVKKAKVKAFSIYQTTSPIIHSIPVIMFLSAKISETLDNKYGLVYNAKYLVKRCSF